MTTWRINLKPGAESDINARKHCLTNGIVGVGWQIEFSKDPITWQEYWDMADDDDVHGTNSSWRTAITALKERIQIADLIWTRDIDGIYYLGRITSDWYYDTSKIAARADIVNVRKCDWRKIGTIASVPGKLVNCFIPARTLQQVHDETVNLFSQIIYNEKSKSNYYKTTSLTGRDIFSLLSFDDCEDALALYLQVVKNYMVIPSSCKMDTVAYEYELIHRVTKERAVAQVKNGRENLNTDKYKDIERTVFLFTTKGECFGKNKKNIHVIDPDEIRNFLYNNVELLPEKMKVWVKLTQ